jgi:hypothetical protein
LILNEIVEPIVEEMEKGAKIEIKIEGTNQKKAEILAIDTLQIPSSNLLSIPSKKIMNQDKPREED